MMPPSNPAGGSSLQKVFTYTRVYTAPAYPESVSSIGNGAIRRQVETEQRQENLQDLGNANSLSGILIRYDYGGLAKPRGGANARHC